MTPLFIGLGGPEMIFIVLIVVLLFGAKRIPELMKGVGKGIKSFKDGVSGLEEQTDVKKVISDTVVKQETNNE